MNSGSQRSALNRMKRLKLAQVTGNSEPENNRGRSRTVLPVIWFFRPSGYFDKQIPRLKHLSFGNSLGNVACDHSN